MNKTISTLLVSGMLATTCLGGIGLTSVARVVHADNVTTTSKSASSSATSESTTVSNTGHTQVVEVETKNEALDDNDATGAPMTVVNRDDFKTEANYFAYLKAHPEVKAADNLPEARSAFAVTSSYASATKEYTLEGLPLTTVVQKSYIGSKYIYALQEDSTGKNVIMSRCLINGDTATMQDTMTLTDFGHGQTLEEYEYNGNYYFWIACGGTELNGDYWWARQIGRLQYQADQTISYTSIPRISSISYANAAGTSLGSIQRTDAALASSGGKLMIWMMTVDKEVRVSTYDAAALNAVMDEKEAESSKFIAASNAKIKAAFDSSHEYSASEWNTMAPNGSTQGFEFSDGDATYVSGGHQNDTYQGIGKYNWESTNESLVNINNLSTDAEIEGLQLKGDDVHANVTLHDTHQSNIYTIPKTAF